MTVVTRSLRTVLRKELGDDLIARRLTAMIRDEVLTWTAPVCGLGGVGGIVACAFGFRQTGRRSIRPGPVNEELARVTVDLYHKTQSPVYAQWEIAECIGRRIPPSRLYVLKPDTNRGKTIQKYLSTIGVMSKAITLMKRSQARSRILIVAHRDHVPRCLSIGRRLGLRRAFAPPVPLPVQYDPKSAQPWTRTRFAYLLHDILCRIEAYRAQATGTASPSGQLD
jgi:hypothetical protein